MENLGQKIRTESFRYHKSKTEKLWKSFFTLAVGIKFSFFIVTVFTRIWCSVCWKLFRKIWSSFAASFSCWRLWHFKHFRKHQVMLFTMLAYKVIWYFLRRRKCFWDYFAIFIEILDQMNIHKMLVVIRDQNMKTLDLMTQVWVSSNMQ